MASTLSLNEILRSLDALSEEERAIVQQYLDTGSSNRSSESLSALLEAWDESLTIEDAEELNRLIRESPLLNRG
jgi:hypothetical protein